MSQGALVDQLVEGVLAVGARLAPVHRAGAVVDPLAVQGDVLAVGLHGQLLQVGREPHQVLVVGQHRLGLRAEEVRRTRRSAGPSAPAGSARSGAVRKCSSMACEPASSWSKLSGPIAIMVDRPIADSIEYRPPTQFQKPNMFAVSMPNLLTASALVETATKCLATAASSPSAASDQSRAELRVGHRLQGGERLGRDDEQRLRRVEIVGLLGEVGAVHVGDEPEGQVPLAVVLERLVGHHRAEVAAADADVDDVADRLAGVPGPLPRADPVGERAHPAEHLVHVRHHVGAVGGRSPRPAGARSATCSTARSSVMLMCSPPNMSARRSARSGLLRELDQQADRLGGHPLLGVVEVDALGLQRQAGAAGRVAGEQLG